MVGAVGVPRLHGRADSVLPIHFPDEAEEVTVCAKCMGRIPPSRARMGATLCRTCFVGGVRPMKQRRVYPPRQPARSYEEARRAIDFKPAWLLDYAVEQRAFLWWLAATQDAKWGEFYDMPHRRQEEYRMAGLRDLKQAHDEEMAEREGADDGR